MADKLELIQTVWSNLLGLVSVRPLSSGPAALRLLAPNSVDVLKNDGFKHGSAA